MTGSLGYLFGPGGGLVLLRFDEEETVDSVEDQVAFGISTNQETRAVLVRMTSGSSRDFITIEMVGL